MAESRFDKYKKSASPETKGSRFEKYKPAAPPRISPVQPALDPSMTAFERFQQKWDRGDIKPINAGQYSSRDDKVRALARGVPIVGGAMDEISAGLNTGFGYLGDYDAALAHERETDRSYDTAHPYESTVLQIGGGLAGSVAAGRMLPKSMPLPKTLPGKVGFGAASSGLLGGWEAFTRGEGGFDNRMADAKKAVGPAAVLGGAMPLIGYGVGKVYDKARMPEPSGVTVKSLQDEAAPLFETAKRANMAMKPEAYDQFVNEIYRTVDDGIVPENMPKLVGALRALDARRGQPIPYSEVMKIEKVLKSAVDLSNPEQTRLAQMAMNRVGDLIDNMDASAIIGDGDPQLIRAIHNEAKALWTRSKNAELLDNIIENAKNTVGANYTDAQFQTAIRQQLKPIAKNNFENYRWLKPDEREAVLRVIRGEGTENFLRAMGKYSPLTLGGVARIGGISYAANSMLPGSGAVVAPLLGTAGGISAPLANQMSKRNTAVLSETLLQGRNALPPPVAEELARMGITYGAPIAGRAGAPVAGLLGGGGW